ESGHYYVVTSPNIQGMVTDGETIPEALENAKDALATMLANELERPEVQDPREWTLDKGQQTSWVSVNMTRWLNKYGKTVRRNISIPADLNEWAKKNKINVSKVATEALYDLQEA
ncbi:type II toxin-antitoxin system HicB family antitoxin, partial [Veillonella sp.]